MLRTSSSGGLSSCSLFGGLCVSSTFHAIFYYLCFFCCLSFVFSSKIKLFVLVLSFDFLVFCSLCSDLKEVFKRIIYPVSKLVLALFGYRGFSFLSHAVRFWFMVISELALVSLDYY